MTKDLTNPVQTAPDELLLSGLNLLKQGIAVFDHKLELVAYNRQFRELLDYPTDLCAPGAHLSVFLRHDFQYLPCAPDDLETQVRVHVNNAAERTPFGFELAVSERLIVAVACEPIGDDGLLVTHTDMTEARRTETALRQSEERHALVTKAATEGLYDWNIEAEDLYVSPRLNDWLRFESGDRRSEVWYARVHPDDRDGYRAAMRAHFKGETDRLECEYRIEAGSGAYRWVFDHGIAVRNEGGRAIRLVGAIRDITETKQAQQALAEEHRTIEMMHHMARAANEAIDTEQLLKAALDEVCAYTGWPVGHAYLVDRDEPDKLVPSELWHIENAERFATFRAVTRRTTFGPGEGLPGRVYASGQPAWNIDIATDPNFPRAKAADDIGVRAGFAFPIVANNSVVAVLEFFSDQVVEVDASVQTTLVNVGHQIGRFEERKLAEERLRESEQNLRRILENSPIGIVILSKRDYKRHYMNPRFLAMMGAHSEDELTSARQQDSYADPTDFERVWTAFTSDEPIVTVEARKKRLDGSLWWALIVRTMTTYKGQDVHLNWHIDISDLKRTEQELAAKSQILGDVLDNIVQGVAKFDGARNLLTWNKRFQDVNRFPDELMTVGRPTNELAEYLARRGDYGEGDPISLAEQRLNFLWSGEANRSEVKFGGENIYDVLTQPTDDGGLVITYTDITLIKEAERAARESEESQRLILETSPIGVVILSKPDFKRLYVNPRFMQMFGADSDDQLMGTRPEGSFADPADLERATTAFSSDEPMVTVEAQRKRLDGSLWWALMVRTMANYKGEDVYLAWHIDITDRREVEESLRESEQNLRQILDTIAQGMAKYDSQKNLRIWNRHFQDFLRLPDELMTVGRPLIELMSDVARRGNYGAGDPDALARTRLESVWGGGASRTEIVIDEANVYDVLSLATDDGGLVSTYTDITLIRKAEREARESEQSQRLILENSPIGVAILSKPGFKRLYVNPRFMQMLGADSEEQLIGARQEDSYADPADFERAETAFSSDEPTVTVEARRKRLDGSLWWMLMVRTEGNYKGEDVYLAWHIDITDRKETERVLRESEQNLRRMLEASPVAVAVIDLETDRAVFANRRVAEMFGISEDALHSIDPATIWDDPSVRFELLKEVRRGVEIRDREMLMRRADGSRVWDIMSLIPMEFEGRPAMLAWHYDITDRKEAEKLVSDQLSFTQALVDAIPNPILVKDPNARYLTFNTAYEDAFGVRREDIIGKTVLELGYLSKDARRAFQKEDEELLRTSGGHRKEVTMTFADGNEHTCLFWKTVFTGSDDKVAGLLGVIVDISEQKELERELSEAKEQADAANRAKSQFLANVSHELRTPLNAIIGYTELIEDNIYGEVPEKITEVIDRVGHSGRHLLGLINDVLDLSKIEAGELNLTLDDYAMDNVVYTVVNNLESLAAEKGLRLTATVPDGLPVARGDEQRIAQVLLNLLGNAIKFTDAGEVKLEVRADNGAFLVSVSDTGLGISEADQARVFDEFQQADGSDTRMRGGTGLGLTITRRMIEMHGGRIWVESILGEGSTFWLSFPVRVDAQVDAA